MEKKYFVELTDIYGNPVKIEVGDILTPLHRKDIFKTDEEGNTIIEMDTGEVILVKESPKTAYEKICKKGLEMLAEKRLKNREQQNCG